MVPAYLEPRDEVPVMPGGKVDRHCLPPLGLGRSGGRGPGWTILEAAVPAGYRPRSP